MLPDFTRWIWNSARARSVWEPRIQRITKAWGRVEIESVARWNRRSALFMLSPDELPRAAEVVASQGLLLMPLQRVGATNQPYTNTPQAVEEGRPWAYRCAVMPIGLAPDWGHAWRNGDDELIGRLLGYPDCCRAFFKTVWVDWKRVDTTAHMETADAIGPPEANILLRWLGVRLVPHLPCSFHCQETVKFAQSFEVSWHEMEFSQELAWAKEMLSWPVEWSGLHGIAEIRTPILTISARTDYTAKKAVVRRPGSAYPEEGAQGLHFPYRIVTGKVTDAPAFTRSVTPVWELNGFTSEAAMRTAHTAILRALPVHEVGGSLLDLGCGTGRLLEQAASQGWKVQGVESDSTRAGAGSLPIRRGDMFNLDTWSGDWDVVMVMPGRLLESPATPPGVFCQALKRRARTVLLYAYGDWLLKYGGLQQLAAEVGLGGGDVLRADAADGVEAMLVHFGPAVHAEDALASASLEG